MTTLQTALQHERTKDNLKNTLRALFIATRIAASEDKTLTKQELLVEAYEGILEMDPPYTTEFELEELRDATQYILEQGAEGNVSLVEGDGKQSV